MTPEPKIACKCRNERGECWATEIDVCTCDCHKPCNLKAEQKPRWWKCGCPEYNNHSIGIPKCEKCGMEQKPDNDPVGALTSPLPKCGCGCWTVEDCACRKPNASDVQSCGCSEELRITCQKHMEEMYGEKPDASMTELVLDLAKRCATYQIGNGEYPEFIQDLEMNFPSIATAYLASEEKCRELEKQIHIWDTAEDYNIRLVKKNTKLETQLRVCAGERNKYLRMLEWLLYQAGRKDGRIPEEECKMIEKILPQLE